MHHASALGRHASPIALLLVTGLMIAATLGAFGSGRNHDFRAVAPAATLSVNTPARIRNGMFFETRIRIEPHQAFSDLILAVEPSLWRDVTVNTMIPAPAEETFEQGAFRLSYGEWEAGAPLEIKIDSQINPSLFRGTEGTIALYDGDERVLALPIEMRVLP